MWATLCWFSLNFSMVLVTRSHIYAPSLFLSQLTDPQKSSYTAVTLIGTCHVMFITDMTHAQFSPLFDYVKGFFFLGLTAPSGPGLFIVKASLSHSASSHSVGLLWMSNHPGAETSTWQHSTFTTESSMPAAEFEATVPANERPQTDALDRMTIVICRVGIRLGIKLITVLYLPRVSFHSHIGPIVRDRHRVSWLKQCSFWIIFLSWPWHTLSRMAFFFSVVFLTS